MRKASLTISLCALIATLFLSDARIWAAEKDPETERPELVTTAPQDGSHQALDWLDRYMTVQVLFDPEDLHKLREKLAQMSPQQQKDWLRGTSRLRTRLDSPQWGRTREILRDFLRKQAIYSDEEIDQMKRRAANMSPGQLMGLLDTIELKLANMSSMHQVSDQQREADVANRDLREEQQDAARRRRQRDVLDARDRYLASQSAAKTRAAAARRNWPLFGSPRREATASRARLRYRPPPPLITSREVARGVVSCEVFRGYCREW